MRRPGAGRVHVLGGGVAGLTAAFALAARGHSVRLLESRGWLGGRAFATPDRASGRRLDNGPHVMLGCYRATRALLRRLGTEAGFVRENALALAFREASVGAFPPGSPPAGATSARGAPAGSVSPGMSPSALASGSPRGSSSGLNVPRTVRLRLSRLPVPLAMPCALLGMPVSWSDRWRALRGLVAVVRRVPATWTLGDWLRARGQHGMPDAFLWRPLCRAIMNVEPEHAAAHDFVATLREAFAGRASRAAIWLPARSWGELIGDPAPGALAAAGVEVTTGARVAALAMHGGRVAALVLGSGERLELGEHDTVVSALPWFALHPLLRDAAGGDAAGAATSFGALQSSPITSVYCTLAADAPPWPEHDPIVALVDGAPFHFLIRRPGDDPRHVALLSGGDRSLDHQPVDTIAARARQQLARYWPSVRTADAAIKVRKEQHATFVAGCGTAAARPRPGLLPGGPSNLRVCGDWTASGLPATLEGAARSAELLVRDWR